MGFANRSGDIMSDTDWTKVFAQHMGTKIPEGYETTSQIAAKCQETVALAYNRLKKLHENGVVDKIKVTHNGIAQSAWKVKG